MMQKISEEMVRLFGLRYYRKFKKHFVFILFLSRLPFLKHNGSYLLFLQRVMAIQLNKIQKTISEGKALTEQIKDEERNKAIFLRISAHRHFARILRGMADGIVWRNLCFNRPLLRLFSDNNSPGYIDKELNTILSVKPLPGEVLIVNDLTNYCRIGDYTCITKG